MIVFGLLSILACSVYAEDESQKTDVYVIFLGTGAADIATPEHCGCDNCKYIREHGGKNQRRYSSLHLHPGILIDFSTTGMDGLKNAGIEPKDIACLLISHSHGDHLDPASIITLAEKRWESIQSDLPIFCNSATAKRIREHLLALDRKAPITLTELKPYQSFQAGEWSCKALEGNHSPDEDCLLYLLQRGDRTILYATDTTWFPVRTFQEIRATKLDLAVVDGTFGPSKDPEHLTGHMNFDFCRLIRELFVNQKTLKPEGTFALTHLSLHWAPPYDLLYEKMAEERILIPYDGLRLPLRAGKDR